MSDRPPVSAPPSPPSPPSSGTASTGVAVGAGTAPPWPAPGSGPGTHAAWGEPATAGPSPSGPKRRSDAWIVVLLVLGGLAVLAGLVWAAGASWSAYGYGWEGEGEWADDGGFGVPFEPVSRYEVDLAVGACALVEGEMTITAVEPVTSCGEPHHLEVFLVGEVDVSDGTGVADAADVCEPAFAAYVGAAYSRSEYGYLAFVPDTSRIREGERTVTCAVTPLYEPHLTDSVRGTRR